MYEEMENISFRVSKLEDMIKGNVKIDDFAKLEKKIATREDLRGTDSKEDIQYFKEFINDIKHKFIPQLSTQ